MSKGITRRAMLATFPSAAFLAAQTSRSRPKARQLPSVGEFVRFPDPTTETSVVRLTTLKSSSYLPAPANRFVSIKERYLIFSSNRSGVLAPYQVDLHSGLVHQLGTPERLISQTLCLDPKEHWLYFLDGDKLVRAEISKREIRHKLEPLAEGIGGFSISPSDAVFVTRGNNLQRLQDQGTSSAVLATDVGRICLAQTGGGQGCLFSREGVTAAESEYWYASGGDSKPLLLAKGAISEPYWEPDGRSVLFLRDVSNKPGLKLTEIHRVALDGLKESCVAPTSAFASFSPNFDATVFVGASRSKAQPNVILLLRSAKRELTLCQHHATNAAAVTPVFSPDARRVYFQSDQEGTPAIYSVNVELLVEPLGGENSQG